MVKAAATPESPSTEPTEMSIPPLMITKVCPKARIMGSVAYDAVAVNVPTEKNPRAKIEKKTTNPTRTREIQLRRGTEVRGIARSVSVCRFFFIRSKLSWRLLAWGGHGQRTVPTPIHPAYFG